MLKVTIICVAIAIVTAQRWTDWFTGGLQTMALDDVHGHTLEYDDRHDLILMVGTSDCYLVSAQDSTWDNIVTHQDQLPHITEALYHQIRNNVGVTPISDRDADIKYHSRLEEWQCRDKSVYEVAFIPPTTAPLTTSTTTPSN